MAERESLGPSPLVRGFVAALLRVGLGVSLLNSGLLNYSAVRNGGTPPFALFAGTTFSAATQALLMTVSFAQIALGLALVLGFFTVAAALLAGVFILITPLSQTLLLIAGGMALNPSPAGGLMLQGWFSPLAMANLLTCAAALWLASPGKNPWSLDALMLVRPAPAEGSEEGELPPAREREPGPPALPPGQRTVAFIARLRGEGDEAQEPAAPPERPTE